MTDKEKDQAQQKPAQEVQEETPKVPTPAELETMTPEERRERAAQILETIRNTQEVQEPKKEAPIDGSIRITIPEPKGPPMPTPEEWESMTDEQREEWARTQREAMPTPEEIAQAGQRMQERMQEITQKIAQAYNPEMIGQMLEGMKDTISGIASTISGSIAAVSDIASGLMSFWQSEQWQSIKETIRYITENADSIRESVEEMEQLQPFIEAELEKPEYKGLTIEELFAEDETGEAPAGSIWEKVLQAAKDERDKALFIESLPLLQSDGLPPKHTMANSYISNELQHGGIIDAGQLNLPVLGDGRKAHKGGELITTSVIATYQPGEGVNIQGSYTEYDRQVQDAIGSLLLYGDTGRRFTPAMVYRAMTHNEAAQPSPQQIGAVTRSIEKQWNIFVSIDASAEFEKRGILGEDGKLLKWHRKQHLLELRLDDVRNGNKILRVYTLLDKPLLLTYSELTGQLLTINAGVLDIRRIDGKGIICESIPNTESRIAIKGYLLRRIEIIKHDIQRAKDNHRKYESRRRGKPELPKKEVSDFMQQSHRILFDTMFAEAGQESKSREIQRRNRDYVCQCLDYWKAIGHIKGYSIVKGQRNAIRGIDIAT